MHWQIRGYNHILLEEGDGVFNGDVGVIRGIDEQDRSVEVLFDDGKCAFYGFDQVGDLELAYAMTIHKSQGSEYPVVILPLLGVPYQMVYRNLLYTAITRAQQCVLILGSGDVVASISQRPDPSILGDVLREQGDEIFSEADAIAVEADLEETVLKPLLDLADRHGKPVYALVSNMTIAIERRDLLRRTSCFVCNGQEAGLLFSEDYTGIPPEELAGMLRDRIRDGEIRRMVVTLGSDGAVYADREGHCGVCPAVPVDVVDTTGCGDAFFAGVCIGMTYGKSLAEACQIGARLAASVIATRENVCPRFRPEELDLDPDRVKHLM
jgi:sugar/nucleoside kinase (ribokinase family)